MADWSKPTLTSTYANYLAETTGRDVDCATQFSTGAPTNVPTGAIKWDSGLGRWQLWSGTAWGDLTSTYNLTGLTCTSLSNTGNTTLGDSSADNVTSNAANWSFANATTVAGNLTYTGSISFNGAVTLGDAAADSVTFNARTLNIPNNVNFTGGNVGVGTATPGVKLDVNGLIRGVGAIESRGSAPMLQLYNTSAGADLKYWRWAGASNGNLLLETVNDAYTGGAERLRIERAGNLFLGTTSAAGLYNGSSVNPGIVMEAVGGLSIQRSSGSNIWLSKATDFTDGTLVAFAATGSIRGSITTNGTTVSYNTTSDQRLKTDIADAPDAGETIDAVKVRQFTWLAEERRENFGFVAQELLNSYPAAVHVPANPDDMMSVDYSKLVPLLVKEVQALRSRVAALEVAT